MVAGYVGGRKNGIDDPQVRMHDHAQRLGPCVGNDWRAQRGKRNENTENPPEDWRRDRTEARRPVPHTGFARQRKRHPALLLKRHPSLIAFPHLRESQIAAIRPGHCLPDLTLVPRLLGSILLRASRSARRRDQNGKIATKDVYRKPITTGATWCN